MKAILSIAIGHLETAIEEESDTPVTQHKEFAFVRDAKLRSIIERDYKELQRAYIAECWKSVIVLAGGQLEAILLDLLIQHKGRAKASAKAPRDKSTNVVLELEDWGLVRLILVAVDLKVVNPGVEKLSHSVREYRDLVHPTVEVKTNLQVGPEEAKIAVEIVNMVHRELSR